MPDAFRIAIAGLGTVGAGVAEIIQHNGPLLEQRTGRKIEIIAVSARSKGKDRGVDVSKYQWIDNPVELADLKNIDAIVEVIGGSDGPAYALVKGALSKGIHVITANKALLAAHGAELAALAEKNNAALAYEAAVAGGIPVIKALREGFGANNIKAVYGILNGTCNYILTTMREAGADFGAVLKEAQDKGYAEADPTFDVDGIDAAHKLCLLTALAFGAAPDMKIMNVRGIRDIQAVDIKFASSFGYRIKLLGIAWNDQGKVGQVVEPCLVPEQSALGKVEGSQNAVFVEGDFVGNGLLTGPGAGKGPTASAVVADIMDLARGARVPAFGIPAKDLKSLQPIDLSVLRSRYYVRLTVLDKPGVIADVSAILRDHQISIESLVQHGRDPDQPVAVVLITHEVTLGDVVKACAQIGKLTVVAEPPCLLRIDELN